MAGQPPYYDSPEALESAIQAIFDKHEKNGTPVTVSGLSYSLGFVSRQSMYDYKEREEYSYIIKRAIHFIESCYEGKLSGTTPTGSIFALKNMGWRDKVETGFTDAQGKDVPFVLNFNPAPKCEPLNPTTQPAVEGT